MRADDFDGDENTAAIGDAYTRETAIGDELPGRVNPASGTHEVLAKRDPLIGAIVADRYRIERLLGEGGIGRVYRALHVQLGRPVALKLLHPDLSGRKDMHMRFEREARAASRLNHVGSVMVFDFGSWNKMLYLAMELVEGRSLDDIIRKDSPLSVARVVDLGGQICDALEVAHAIGLLHRDLKPENVLVATSSEGREHIKICDYGLAYLIGDANQNAPRLTREGTVAGTPTFMAPEQILSRTLDQRTDLYALGCVLYEMVCGRVPFDGSGSMEILTKQLYDEPEPPSRRSLHPVPRELEQVILWTLQKIPGKRPQRAAELKAALLAVLEPLTKRSDKPTGEEVQVLFDREARAEAAGISPPPARTTADFAPTAAEMLVIAAANTSFDQSAVAVLRAHGTKVRTAEDFETSAENDGIVVDLRDDPWAGLQRLAEAQARLPWLAKATIVVVGPDDDFAVMARALELQSAEYVPESLLPTLPRKLHRALERARRNRS